MARALFTTPLSARSLSIDSEMMSTCAPSPYLAAHILIWAAFLRRRNPRAAFCEERRERLFCLSSVSINQSQNTARCGLSVIGRVMYVCTMLSITCARLARSLSIHYRLITHGQRARRCFVSTSDSFCFFAKHLANQHVAMPVALNQNLTFEDAMARRFIRATR